MGDSGRRGPRAPPEAEGTSQQEEEEDEAEYFRQAVARSLMKVWQTGLRAPGYHAPVCPCTLVALDTAFSLQTCFQRQPRGRRPTGPPGKKQQLKERKPTKAVNGGLSKGRVEAQAPRPRWDTGGLPGTMGKARPRPPGGSKAA